MRLRYDNKYDTGDGFSTTFSDLVFGLLFVFFLLSIALIFQRPEVDQFQDRIDALEKELRQAQALIDATDKLNKELIGKNKQLTSRVSSLVQEVNELKKNLVKKDKLLKVIETSRDKCRDELSKLKLKHENLVRVYRNLKAKYDRLRENKNKTTAKKLKKMSAQLKKLKKKEEKLARSKAELESILGSLKKLLRAGGYMEILAELEGMQDKLAGREKGQGKESVLSPFRIKVKYDPNVGFVDASVEYSPSDQQYLGELWEEDLLNIAKDLKAEYKSVSESYTELEKRENRPKLYLSVHPDTPHWQVQEILAKIKSTIPVVIVPWGTAAP